MEEPKQLTDSEKLDVINKRLKHIAASTHIQTAIMIVGFLGILSLGALLTKVKNNFIK